MLILKGNDILRACSINDFETLETLLKDTERDVNVHDDNKVLYLIF